jgi:hypothetical protein
VVPPSLVPWWECRYGMQGWNDNVLDSVYSVAGNELGRYTGELGVIERIRCLYTTLGECYGALGVNSHNHQQ